MTPHGVRVKSVSREAAISRLRTYVSRFERRYECPSAVMLEAVQHGLHKETAEVTRWLSNYQALKALEERSGHMGGAHTRNI